MSLKPKNPARNSDQISTSAASVLLPLSELAKFHETPCAGDEFDDYGLVPVATLPNGLNLYDPQEYLERMIRNAKGFDYDEDEDDDETIYAPAIYQVPDPPRRPRQKAKRKSKSVRLRKAKSRSNA